ncbi:GAP family protein [Mycobacterium tuberculosis]|uniref:GAP family protein n=1 Tax=Mycobacterium tuberculosis TaxID=1773 RepID=UPI003393A535
MWTMVLLLGLGMAIDPARLGLAVVMLSRRRPMLNLFAFWVGGMVAGVGIALAVLVFMRDVALAAIQGVVSAANEFREAVGILAGGRLHIVIGVIMLLLAARMVARARAQVGVPVGPVGVADGGMSALALAQRPPGLVARLVMLRFQDWVRSNRRQISLTILIGVGFLFLYQGVTSL